MKMTVNMKRNETMAINRNLTSNNSSLVKNVLNIFLDTVSK